MKKLAPLFALPLALFVLCGEPAAAQTMNSMNTPAAPAAKKVPKETKIHGETIVDPYFWMREKTSPEVVSYLEAENAYADAYMKPTAALQEKLYKEMLGRIKQTDTQVPYRENGYLYYTRTVEGKQYPIFARRKGSMDAPEEVTLDVNELAVGHKYTGIGAYAVSDDGNLLAYSVDHDGHRDYKLHVKDLRTGKELPDSLGVVVYVFWAPTVRRSSTARRTRPSARTSCGGTPSATPRRRTRSSPKRRTSFSASTRAARATAATSWSSPTARTRAR
jgi:oligopeptidase B